MLELCTLASGSSGNCLLLAGGQTRLLIDAGISARRICTGLRALGIEPSSLTGILVTHEHSDHISGLENLSKKYTVPIYASAGTAGYLCGRAAFLEERIRTFQPGARFCVGGLEVESFATPHDACQSVGYAVSCGGSKAAVVTDLGCVTEAVSAGVRGSRLLLVETNHDIDWLWSGPYPASLKRRIAGPRGHLSNEDGAALACAAASGGAKTVILGHLSARNNTPERARCAVEAALERAGIQAGRDVLLEVAPKAELSRRYEV